MNTGTRSISRSSAIWGGLAYVVAMVQYGLAQVISAAAWKTPYNWLTNEISDLGNTACGQFSVHGPTSYICSPLHAMMNASFIVSGLLVIAGTVLLWRLWPESRMITTAKVLMILSGIGKVIVGLVPENTDTSLHILGATNIVVGNVAILLISIAIRHYYPALTRAGRLVSLLGITGSILFSVAQYAGSDLWLGAGGWERVAGYPSNLWLIAIGIISIYTAGRGGLRRIIPVLSVHTPGTVPSHA
jgi:hypothetical membrane protein